MKKNFILCSFLLLSSCAPGLGKTVEITSLEPAQINARNASIVENFSRLRVESFQDLRMGMPIIVINGREVQTESKIPAVVRSAFEDAIKAYGGKLCLLDCASVSGEILEWKAIVKTGFPSSTSKSHAVLRVILKDEKGREIHRGTYKGSSQSESPLSGEEMILKDLSQAMNQAITAFLEIKAR